MKLVDYLRQKLHVCVVVDPTHDILNFVIEYLCKNCFMESLKQQIEVENLVTLSPNKNINLNLFQGTMYCNVRNESYDILPQIPMTQKQVLYAKCTK